MRIDLQAFAKVNLDLRLRGLRSDGYHDVSTVLQSIALADDVSCEAVDGPLALECDAPGVPGGERNLAWRAAVATWRALGRSGEPSGLRIRLVKRVPAQAGLGGGSADAAAVVWASQRVWGGRLEAADEQRVLAGLGADVPFFVRGGTMLGSGRGDQLLPLPDLPSTPLVVAVPAVGVATPDAYRWFDERHPDGMGSDPVAWPTTPAVWPGRLPACVNDFEPVVVERVPAVGACLRALGEAGAVVTRLSGSGSAVFGLFDTVDRAAAALALVRGAGARAFLTRSLGSGEAGYASQWAG